LRWKGEYLVDDFDEGFWGDDELPDVETIGGLVVTKLGRPPRVGDEVVYNEDVRLHVLAVDRRAVSRVRIEFPAPMDKIKRKNTIRKTKQRETRSKSK
jgi:CBS domain containing-hemolysin-like protein